MRRLYRALTVIGILLLLQDSGNAADDCREGNQDIYFLVESSLSVNPSSFRLLKNYIRDVGKQLGVGQTANRISLTLFNKDIQDIIDPKDVKGFKDLTQRLDATSHWNGKTKTTNLGNAMEFLTDSKFTDERGRREDTKAVCVIIFEGSSSDQTEKAAEKLRTMCRILVMGVNRPNYYELSKIGSKPTMGHVKTLQSYIDLIRFVKWTAATICKPPIAAMRMEKGRVADTSIQIIWETQPYASKYIVQIRNSGKSKALKVFKPEPTDNNVTFTGLKEGTSYSIDGWAVDHDGEKGPRSVLYVSSGIKVPKLILDELSVTKTTAVVRWKMARLPGVTYFITIRDLVTQSLFLSTGVSGSSHLIKKMRPGTSYTVEIAAVYKGAKSDSNQRIVINTVPDPPRPKTKYVTDRAVRLEWEPVRGSAIYGIRTYDTETGKLELLVRIDETENTTFEVKPLLSGKRYKFTLTSKTKGGQESDESPPIFERIAPSNPRKINLISRNTRMIKIGWEAQETVSQYMIQFKLEISPDLLTRIVNTTEFVAEGLVSGGIYLFKVFSIGTDSKTDTENPAVAKIQSVPAKVEGVRIQEITENSVTMQWNNMRGAEEYLVTFKNSLTGKVLRKEKVKSDSIKATDLKTGITYHITVSSVGLNVVGRESDPQVVVTLPDVPEKPTLIKKTNKTLTFQWKAVPGAIQYVADIQSEDATGPTQFRTRKTSFTFEELKPGTWYTLRLRSVGSGGRINMRMSEAGEGQTVPAVPKKARISELTASSVTIKFNKVKAATGYIINIRMIGRKGLFETRNTTETEYNVVNLESGESYLAGIKAYAYDGSISAESENTLMKTMPSAPDKPRVLSVSSRTVTLEWDEVKGASAYVISISDKRKLTEVKTEDTQFTIEGLTPSTQYSFGLYSVAIEGTRNKKESKRVEALTAPRPPTDVRIVNAETTYVELAWNAVRGAVSYIVRYKSIGEDEGLQSGEMPAKNPSFQAIRKLTAGMIYEFSVIAIGTDGSKSDPGILVDGTLPATPDKPLILLIGSTTATLSWNPAKGAESYIIFARAKGFEKKFKSNTTRVEIDGLQSGTKYEFTVISVGIKRRVNYFESEKKREQTLTSPPEGFSLLNSTSTTVELTWNKMKGAVYYVVQVRLADGTFVQKYIAFKLPYTVKRLKPGVEYKFFVGSVGTNFIESDFGEPIPVTTIPAAPKPPTIVDIKDTSVSFEWKPVVGAVRYIMSVREEGKVKERSINVDKTEIEVKGLEPGTHYVFYTYSVGAGDIINYEPSGEVTAQTDPAIPSNVAFVNSTTSSVTLSWDEIKGARYYEVYVNQDGKSFSNLTSRGNVYTAWSLKPGVVYDFTVSAFGEDKSKSRESKVLTASTSTEAPMQPILTDISSTEATLEWADIPGAVKYILYYVKDGEKKSQETTKTKIVVTDLVPGQWYDFSVVSVGSGGEKSEESDLLDEQTVPLIPANVRAKTVEMDHITVIWDKSAGASSYKLTYNWQDDDRETRKETVNTESTSVNLSNLTPGTKYEIKVLAIGQTGSRTQQSKALIENTIPSTPNTPVVMNVETDVFTVDWEEVKGASSYVVEITPEIGAKYIRITERTEWTEKGTKPGKWFKINIQSRDDKNRGNGVATDMLELQTICLRPSNVKMSEIGTTFVKFGWNEMEGADFYVVTILWSVKDELVNRFGSQEIPEAETVVWEGESGIKKDGLKASKLEQFEINPSEVAVKDKRAWFQFQTRTNSIEIVGLDSATQYSFQFETVNQQGKVSHGKVYMNETTVPEKVGTVTLLGVTDSSAMFTWDAVEGIIHYIINVTSQSNGRVKTFKSKSSMITLKELAPGSWFNVEIFTVGSDGNMNYEGSEELSFQTVPSPPTNFEITNVSTTTMDLSWDESEGASYYKIIIRLTEPFRVVHRVVEVRTNSHTVEKLSPGTKYLFTVVSVSTGGRESTSSRLILETTTPAKPSDLRLMDISSTTANLQWQDIEGAFKYVVSIRGDDKTSSEVETKGTVIAIDNLTPGVWYEFWVKSVGSNGKVNQKESNIIRKQTVPESPDPIKIEEVTTTTIALSWKKVHGIKQYRLFVEEAGDTTGNTLRVFNVTRSFFTLSQLTPGMTYSISAIAVGTSGVSSVKSDTVQKATVPGSIGELNVTDVSTSHVGLKWTPITGASMYTLLMRLPGSGKIVKSLDTKKSSLVVTSLQPGSTYIFSVTVIGKDKKKSGESPEIQVQTTPLSPTGVKSEKVTTTAIDLSWNKVRGVKLYKVIIREQGSSSIWRTDEVQKTQHSVVQLTPGKTYVLRVVSVATSGRESTAAAAVTETTFPEKPTGLQFIDIKSTSMSLKWDEVIGAEQYTIYVQGDDKTNRELTSTEAEVTIKALSPGQFYKIFVLAVGRKKRQSKQSDKLREQTAPLSPSKLLMTKTGTTFISFQWEPVRGAKFYEVTIHGRTGPTETGKQTSQTFISDDTDYTVNQLVPGVAYTITVVGVGTSGRKSRPSQELKQTTVPAALDDVIVEDATATSVTLRWSGVTGASSYTIVVRSASDRSNAVLRTVDTTETTFTVPALVPGDLYFFSIRSKGFGGKLSKESPRVEAQTVPLQPSDVEVTEVGTTTMSLKWKSVNGAGFYRVSTKPKQGDKTKTDDVRETEHKVEGLNPGVEYVITISAVGTSGREGKASSPVKQVTKPSGPTGVTLSNVRTNSITVKWNEVTGARNYKVIVQEKGKVDVEEYDTLTNSHFLTELQPGTEYSVSVSSVGYDGQESAPSGQVSEQTMPNPPNMLRIIDTTETSISFRWEDVRGAIGYVVVMTEVLFGTETRIETISNKITVKDLSPGTEYEFRVLSVGKKDRINTVPSRMLIEQTVSSPVQGVQIMSVTPKTVLLGWSRSPGVARYVIKVRDHSTGVLVERFDVIAKQQLVEDLQPGKNYSFTVTSIANNGKESDESEPAVISTKLSTPAEPVARTVTNSSATLRWKEVEGAREYIVIVRDVEQATQTRITVEEEFIVVEELVPGTTYSFSIIAVGESGKQSEKGPTTTLHTIPQIPRIKKVDSIATDYLSISWDGVKGATRYVIYARWKRPGVRQPRVINATTTMTSYKFKVPLPGVKYDITVEAEGKGGKSQESAILEESSLPEAPPTPKTDEVSTTSANMKWEPVPGAASYEVQILDESTGKEETLVVYKAEVQLKGLDAGNWYSIKVFSRDSKGRMNKEGSSAFRIQTVPSPPARMQIEKVTMDSVSVTWRKVVGAENYVLTVTADESEVVEFAKSWQNVEMSNGQVSFRITTDKNMATVDGLKSGSQFRFEVQAIGAQGGKSESISMEATTLPAIVEDVLVSKISTTSATIRWTDVKGASFYRVRVRNRQKPIVQNVQQPVATMTGLIAGTWYNVSVTTFDILNRTSGVQSENVQFQTVPRKITDFESSETTINSMKISWKSVKGAKSYELKLLWIADEVSSGHLKGEAPQDRDGLTFKTFKSPLTQIKLSQLDPGTTYWYEITSFSEEGRRSLPSNRANETTLPDGIAEINIDAVTNTLISLSWEPIKGAGSYAILISNMKAAGSPMRRQTKRPEIIVDNLNPGVAYEFVIRPRGVKGNQDEVETSSIRVKTIPLPPSSIKVDSVSQTSIDISWTPSRGATRYGILAEYKDMNRRLRTLEFESTTPDFRIRDLQSGISYVLQVVAYGNRNEASKSERSPAIVQRTKLAAPANLTLDDFAEDYVALSWEPTTGATAYTVYVRDVEKDDITPIDLENELFTDVTNLEPGVLYSFSVRGINRKDDMMSEHSNIVQQRTVPSAPQFVTVIEVGADFIDVKWDPVVGADFYTIFLAEKGEAEEMIPDYLFTSAMLSDLKPGTEYRIQIMATSVEGYESRRSDRLTQATAPNAPGTPTVKSFNTNSIELEWERMQGATSYIITMTDEQTKEKSEIDAGSTLTFLISDLSPGSVYSFTIRGEDQDKGLTSDESGSITQGTYPETPNVQVISFSPDRISLSWNKIEGAHSYTLYVKEVDGSKGEQEIEKLKATKYTIDELKSGSEYEIQVVAITEGGLRSDRSVRVIQFTSPNSPSGLAAVNVTQNAFTVTWIPAAGATSYTLVLTNIETSEKTRVDVEGVLQYRFNKLKAGTMFSIYAFALTLPDDTRSDRSETIEQRTLPLAPKKVVIFDVKESSISLEWKKVKGAKTYTVFVNRVGDAQGLERQVKDIATPLVTVDRLSPGTLYQFEVASVTEDRLAGKRSDQVQQQTVPAPPQDIVISEVTSTSFRVNWTKSEGATSYSLKVVNEDTKQERIKSVGNTVTTKFIRLVPGSLYRITVNAQRKDADVTSRNSYRVMQRTLPLAPTNLRVTSRFSDAVSLEWDDTKGVASFHIYIYELNEDGTPKGDELFIDGILDLTVEIIDLDPGSLYEFEVVSVTEEGETSEDGALISERTRYAAPIMPQSTKPLVRLSKVGSSTATATWDAIQFAFEYRLLAISDDAANVAVDFINGTTAVIEGLSANTEYLVTLVAIGRSGDETEESSPPAILNTLPLPPSKPSGLDATGLTKDSILLTWEPSPRAQSYEIEKVDPVTKNKQVIRKILEPQWEIKDLRPGKIYVFRVTAVGRFEKSELSDEIRTGSTHPIPQMPYTGVELIQASNIRWNGFTLTLQRIPDAVTYTIIMRTGGEIFREINNIRFTRYPVGNLTEMTTYEVTYVGVGAGGEESDESDPSLFATTLANTPEIPKGVGASDMTAESVVVEWDDADRAVSYDVIITELLTSIPTFFQDVSSPFIATGLVFDTRYAVAVVSVGNFDRSRPSGQVRFKTKIPKPGDVRVIRTRFVEENAIGLLWSPAIYAVSYTISVSLNGKQVQTHKEILGNSIRIENLKPDKNYKVGVKPIGLEKDEGNEQYIYVTTLPTSGSDEDYDENINEFGIDESTLDDDESEEQPGDPGKLTSPRSPKPDSLEDALSKLISDMMDLPDDEITKSSSGKEIIKESSIFRNRIWRTVESIRRFVMGQTLFQLAERKSDLSILQQRNSKEVSDQMDKLIILSRHIRDDGKELGRSGAKKFAMEIAGILSTIFLQTPETEGISAADKEDIQEEMAPILEDLLLEVILGEFEVKISLVQARNIALTWSGKIPTDEIVFKIREVDSDTFLESITVDKDTPDVKFQKLSPNTNYEIFVATSDDTRILYSEETTTKQGLFVVPPPPPIALRIQFAARSYITVRWKKVVKENTEITYIVRLYRPNGKKVIERFKMQKATSLNITKLKRKTSYDVTVSSYDIGAKKQSKESPRLRIRTK